MNNKYKELSKEELSRLVEKQEKELKTKKYGLVWDSEREPEQVVLDCENNLPVLERATKKEVKTDNGEDNILIEGDNYHALTVLNYTHKEKIDVIYIDPPFNTGNKMWKYNNKYVDEEDGYIHSKWLNMMGKRLSLAKKLLKENGIIAIAIDHYELFNLGLLCNKVFGENNQIGIITIVHKPEGRQFAKFCSYTNEHMLLYCKDISKVNFQNVVLDEDIAKTFDKEDDRGQYKLKPFMRIGGGDVSLRKNKPKGFYPVFVNSRDYQDITLENKHNYIEVLPIKKSGQERTWKTYKDTFLEKLMANDIVAKRDSNGQLQIYEKYRKDKKGQVIKTTWTDTKYHAIHYGTNLLAGIIGKQKFNFPKSLYLVLDTLKLTSKRDAIILDFFAGSGTAGHAVLKLNKEDGGNRKFILCTNNEVSADEEKEFRKKHSLSSSDFKKWKKESRKEWLEFQEENGICSAVCYPRVKKVIDGYTNLRGKKIEGLGGNLQYFKTSFVKRTKNSDQLKLNLTQKCTQMLCVKENIFNLKKEGPDYKIFSSNRDDKFLCVYYNFMDDSFEEFLAEIKKLKGKKTIYMFSVDNTINEDLFSEIKDFSIEAIPQQILDIYKQLIRLSIRRK